MYILLEFLRSDIGFVPFLRTLFHGHLQEFGDRIGKLMSPNSSLEDNISYVDCEGKVLEEGRSSVRAQVFDKLWSNHNASHPPRFARNPIKWGYVLFALLSGTESLSHTGQEWLQRNWVQNIRWSWMNPNIACPEVISWSSLAWGNMKWKVRNTWISKGTQNSQVLMELAGVANLESWSFGTWFRLTACGYSWDWRKGPLVRGKGCECLEFHLLPNLIYFEYTNCNGRGYTSVLGSMMISNKTFLGKLNKMSENSIPPLSSWLRSSTWDHKCHRGTHRSSIHLARLGSSEAAFRMFFACLNPQKSWPISRLPLSL